MHKTYLYLALALICSLPLRGELTVVIAVDGLDHDALQELQPFWPQGGLRTLSEEAYQTTVQYSHWLYGGDEALATLLTGVNPSEHGVCSNFYFSRDTRGEVDLFLGDKRLAIGTAKAYSASALLALTATDRLRLRYGPSSRIYAIGIQPSSTILLAGHAANACCWIGPSSKNSDSLRWVSTSYYREGLPAVADQQNMSGELSRTLQREWVPRLDANTYLHATDEEKKHGFKYNIHSTPYTLHPNSNTAVVELALALQEDKSLGKATTPDVLLLQLTALTPKAEQASLASAEQEDMYLRLNQNLGFLMEQLQKRIGRESLRVVVMGLPKLGDNSSLMSAYNMPVQTLSIDRVTALTSTYLMALYGHERWIDGGYGHSIYLNRMLIEQKRLPFETILRQVSDFLMAFDGIAFACPASEAYLHQDMAPSLHKRFIGDVVFTLQPNYTLHSTPYTLHPTPILIWSGAHRPFPPTIKNATEVANYIF